MRPVEYVTFFKLDETAFNPTRNNVNDGGLDIYALHDTFIGHGETKVVETGIAIKVPNGYVGQICDRSSMAIKGLAVGAGIVDAGYTGSCDVVLHNLTHKDDHTYTYQSGYWIKRGDKVAQLILVQVETPTPVEVFDLWSSERGARGLGSSGR